MASTGQVCGQFATPTNPDLGRCATKRNKTTCEAPSLPTSPCNASFQITYDAQGRPRFRAFSVVYDTECNPVLDTLGAEISGNST